MFDLIFSFTILLLFFLSDYFTRFIEANNYLNRNSFADATEMVEVVNGIVAELSDPQYAAVSPFYIFICSILISAVLTCVI